MGLLGLLIIYLKDLVGIHIGQGRDHEEEQLPVGYVVDEVKVSVDG